MVVYWVDVEFGGFEIWWGGGDEFGAGGAKEFFVKGEGVRASALEAG